MTGMQTERLYRRQISRLVEIPPGPAPALAAADSFLVSNGAVIGWPLHWQRFSGTVGHAAAWSQQELNRFRHDVITLLSGFNGFPRLELTTGTPGDLQLRLRPVGTLHTQARIRIGRHGDPRHQPGRKGPDFETCAALLDDAHASGCDEYLIRNQAGQPLECAYASLVCWDAGTLVTMPEDAAILPGVTQQLVLELAQQHGVTVRRTPIGLAQLQTSETWLLNARHGIRVVTHWDGVAAPAADDARLQRFRTQLADRREPIQKADAKIS